MATSLPGSPASVVGAIPSFSPSGVLPPFLGADPSNPAQMSPYKTDTVSFVDRFASNDPRKEILAGLFAFRQHLRSLGLFGFQWLDGSFCEDVEANESRSPSDIDVVTFFYRPAASASSADWSNFFTANRAIFDPVQTKSIYKCDAYFVDLSIPSVDIVNQTKYWFGLFSHKRTIGLWKGMLQIPLEHIDDSAALALLATK